MPDQEKAFIEFPEALEQVSDERLLELVTTGVTLYALDAAAFELRRRASKAQKLAITQFDLAQRLRDAAAVLLTRDTTTEEQ